MKKTFIYIGISALLLTGCVKKVLDKRDLTGLGDETWTNESTATLYLNRCYSLIMPNWPANAGTATLPFAIHNTNDESSTIGSTAILYGTLGNDAVTDFGTVSGSGSNTYSNIRRVNILLQEIDKGSLPAETRRRIKAQAYFLRAWNYYNLVKLYGGVPYITYPQLLEEDLNFPRNTTSQCIDSLVRDLDSAAAGGAAETIATQTSGNRGRIHRGAALALKGRMLLYFASAEFNPTNDATKWQRAYAANKAAYDTLVRDGHALLSNFANVLTDETANNREVVMIRSYDGVNAFNSFENAARPSSEGGGGGYQPTWDLVRAFPMRNGLPITDAASGYDTTYFWRNRDPRFDATIVWNGSVWALSQTAGRRQWAYTTTGSAPNPENTVTATGFYCRKGVNLSTSRLNAAQGTTDWVEIRLAEVMLNLAECANATGRTAEAYTLMTAIRQRAGITAGTGNLYGLKANMTRDEMQTAIINERRIEFAFEGKRYDDLRRTKLWTSLNGTFRRKMTITINAPYTADSLNRFISGSTTTRVRDTINIDGPAYTRIFRQTVSNIEAASSPIRFLDNYYYYAIPIQHIGRNPNIRQTNGWTNGSFDPLQ